MSCPPGTTTTTTVPEVTTTTRYGHKHAAFLPPRLPRSVCQPLVWTNVFIQCF